MMHGIEYGDHFVTCPGFLGKGIYHILLSFYFLVFFIYTCPFPLASQCHYVCVQGFRSFRVWMVLIIHLSSMNTFTGRQKKQDCNVC